LENDNKIPGLTINWDKEEYSYSHCFNLVRKDMYIPSITRNGIELKNPDYLYKFYSKSNYNIHSLLKGYLYFSSPRNFNDPFDCLVNREEYIYKRGAEIIKHREQIGVCCFSLINSNPLMWGHYTDNYTGFCIKFKNESLLKSIDIPIRFHVSYLKKYQPSDKSLKKCLSIIDQTELMNEHKKYIKTYITLLFEYCWKYYDWQYEQEFRAISWSTDNFDRKYSFNNEDIEEIYIGYKMKDADIAYYDLLIEILNNYYRKTKIYIVKPNPFDVKLDFNELSFNS